MVTDQTYSCARTLVIPSLNIEEVLPESGTVGDRHSGAARAASCSIAVRWGCTAA